MADSVVDEKTDISRKFTAQDLQALFVFKESKCETYDLMQAAEATALKAKPKHPRGRADINSNTDNIAPSSSAGDRINSQDWDFYHGLTQMTDECLRTCQNELERHVISFVFCRRDVALPSTSPNNNPNSPHVGSESLSSSGLDHITTNNSNNPNTELTAAEPVGGRPMVKIERNCGNSSLSSGSVTVRSRESESSRVDHAHEKEKENILPHIHVQSESEMKISRSSLKNETNKPRKKRRQICSSSEEDESQDDQADTQAGGGRELTEERSEPENDIYMVSDPVNDLELDLDADDY